MKEGQKAGDENFDARSSGARLSPSLKNGLILGKSGYASITCASKKRLMETGIKELPGHRARHGLDTMIEGYEREFRAIRIKCHLRNNYIKNIEF